MVLLIGAIGFFVWAHNFSGIPPSAENYTPNFWFDSNEKYFPADPLEFYYENDEEIEGEKAIAKYNSLSLSEKLSNFKVFYTINDQGNEWVYEYWLFYVMNDFENGHYGDWESVFIFVDKNSGRIIRVNSSAHGSSNELNDVNNQNHIWNYVGNGSHANCPDEPANGRCDFFGWQFREGKDWDINGPKIYYNQYVLKESGNTFIQNFKNQKSFNREKSPTLGINLYKTFRLQDFNIPKPKKKYFCKFADFGGNVWEDAGACVGSAAV